MTACILLTWLKLMALDGELAKAACAITFRWGSLSSRNLHKPLSGYPAWPTTDITRLSATRNASSSNAIQPGRHSRHGTSPVHQLCVSA